MKTLIAVLILAMFAGCTGTGSSFNVDPGKRNNPDLKATPDSSKSGGVYGRGGDGSDSPASRSCGGCDRGR